MNKREGAIIGAYTGILCGDFNTLHKYIEEIMGGPVLAHMISFFNREIKKRSEKDFISLCENQTNE